MNVIFKKAPVFSIILCFLLAIPLLAKGDNEVKNANIKEFTPSEEIGKMEPINVNNADVKKLSALKGISKVRAMAIVKHRNENGLYKSLKDLEKVPGIGRKTLEKNKHRIIFGLNPNIEDNSVSEEKEMERIE